MYLPEMIEPYMEMLEYERALSPHTLRARRDTLRVFTKHFTNSDMLQPSDIVRYYTNGCLQLNTNTAREYLWRIAAFLEWVETTTDTKHEVSGSLRVKIANIPTTVTPEVYLEPHEFKNMLECARTQDEKDLLLVMVATGVRAEEITGFRSHHLDHYKHILTVYGKGSGGCVPRPVNFPDNLVCCWPGACRRAIKFNDNPRNLGRFIKKLAKRTGIKKNITAHTLRHTCATWMLKETGNLKYVQKLLGHKNISTTMRYVHILNDDVLKAQTAVFKNNGIYRQKKEEKTNV